jgi:hypothetical protein
MEFAPALDAGENIFAEVVNHWRGKRDLLVFGQLMISRVASCLYAYIPINSM